MHNLLEDEEPNGVPHPASVRSKQAEGVESNGNAPKHRRDDGEVHANIDPLEKAYCSRYAQEDYIMLVLNRHHL